MRLFFCAAKGSSPRVRIEEIIETMQAGTPLEYYWLDSCGEYMPPPQ